MNADYSKRAKKAWETRRINQQATALAEAMVEKILKERAADRAKKAWDTRRSKQKATS